MTFPRSQHKKNRLSEPARTIDTPTIKSPCSLHRSIEMLGTVDRFGHRSGNSSRSRLVGPTDNKQGTAAGIAHTIRRLLDRHYAERITLDVIGDALGLSPFKILRNFQRCYGISPHRYLIERRVSKASALLLDGVRPAEVAVLVGFVDQSHLTKHFKRIWGMTPGRFYATRRSAPAGPDAAAATRALKRCAGARARRA